MAPTLPTEPYKGTRDFYPEDMAIQKYLYSTWTRVAESYGFEEYDASLLEPSDLYRSKGAENEEIVNEQTYTFTDRGEREVTLRPEMTPTVARMIAGKRREIAFPARWYSIPNLFRYERMQRGRLREHRQLNCDIFGSDHYSADIEIIALGYDIVKSFGADDDMFEIRLNDRKWIHDEFNKQELDGVARGKLLALLDKKDKINNFDEEAEKIAGRPISLDLTTPPDDSNLTHVIEGLRELGIENVRVSPSTVRGFMYYTGTIFEFFDTAEENNRSLLGGGRYDNLTELFGGEPIPGVGFGMGDVTMKDFLETHNLLTANITAPRLAILPTDDSLNLEAEKLARHLRSQGIASSVDISSRKIGKKISAASDALSEFALVLGENEIQSGTFTIKELASGEEVTGSLDDIAEKLS